MVYSKWIHRKYVEASPKININFLDFFLIILITELCVNQINFPKTEIKVGHIFARQIWLITGKKYICDAAKLVWAWRKKNSS